MTTVTAATSSTRKGRSTLATVGKNLRELTVLPGLIILIVIGSVVSPIFLTSSNASLVLQQSSELGVVAIGLTFIVLTGRIDISLESTVGFAPMVASLLMVTKADGGWGTNVGAAAGILITMAVGAVIGLINGLLIVKVKLDSFIVGLSMLILLRGVTTGISKGRTLSNLPGGYTYLGTASWLNIPVDIWVTVILFVVAGVLLKYHRWGRSLYAIGGNENAARAAGIRVDRVLILAFVVASALAALAGLLLAGRLSAVTADAGQNLIFSALAATVIGGIALKGGQGRIVGAALGVVLLGTLTNVLTLGGISTFWIDAVYGAVILVALLAGRVTGAQRT
jgi:ribose/xylose/arabinose/galactoside ABC-type transport system permease subunit